MSKENSSALPSKEGATAAIPKKENRTSKTATSASNGTMNAEQATSLIVAPYVTEKTFNQIEKENKLAFIVSEKASKTQILEAIRILYEAEGIDVNTIRTIRGKKAFVRFKAAEGARDLATKLGLV
ncbi:MAG TPA: 50S ribosomal protein L23 [Nitrososphaera sp.]|jgi:large subunit ribosomal protein L23|nr:50S ribosomal protein L23 [Nitrososphaera sp.]